MMLKWKKVHSVWMNRALKLAKQASQLDEVPVAAVLVSKENIELGSAINSSLQTGDPTAHAEMLLLRHVFKKETQYLNDLTLYVTLEPCLMCLGAIIQCKVKRLIFGAYDPKRGAVGSTSDILQLQGIDWRPDVMGGLLSKESGELLREFFKTKRFYKECKPSSL